jgi:uncharacterized protein (DUF169 family)
VVHDRPTSVTCGRLAETPVEPDAVLLRVTPNQPMVIADALPGLRIESKPPRHVVAVAKEADEVAASVGCALSRVRTGMPAAEMTCAIPAGRLRSVLEALSTTARAVTTVARYVAEDAKRFA